MRAFGIREHAEADHEFDEFATLWRHGGSPLLRELIDAGTIELLGGPLSHPFQPLLNPRLREFALREGLFDADQRFAHTPTGIWAPECAYAPGMEIDYAAAGVGHFMVDGPSLHGDTALGRPVADSTVVAFGATCRSATGCGRRSRAIPVTPPTAISTPTTTSPASNPLASPAATCRRRRRRPTIPSAPTPPSTATSRISSRWSADASSSPIGRPAHVVAAFDTELFGHWWYEGPTWLERVLRALPEAGIRLGTLGDAVADGFVGSPVELPASSWGSGKDWQVWAGDQVTDFVRLNNEVTDTALATVDKALAQNATVGAPTPRDRVADQILREATADGLERLAVHGVRRLRCRLRPLPRPSHAHATREIADALAAGRRSTPNAWPTAGIAPTACSAHSTRKTPPMTHSVR